MTVAADLQTAIDGLIHAAIQVGIGAVVLGVGVVLAYAIVRGALRP